MLFSIDSCDFIQMIVNDNRIYFPASSHLQGKNIHAIMINDDVMGTDITGDYTLDDTDNSYITLYDISGKMIFDRLPLKQLSTSNTNYYIIDRVIDWERSFIEKPLDPLDTVTSAVFFSVFINGQSKAPKKDPENIYTLTYPVSNTAETILFKNFHALNGKKISRITLNDADHVNGYLTLVPKDKKRYINNLPLSFFYTHWSYDIDIRYINPVEIDWDRSYLLLRPTSEAEYYNTLNINLHYE